MQKSNKYLLPLLFAVTLAAGMLIGTKMDIGLNQKVLQSKNDKFNEVLNYITSSYVDTINEDVIIDDAITKMLLNLDPHSYYIPAIDMAEVTQDLEGDFEGIGIEFNILNDTIIVVTPIAGGPSEQRGILAGDKIIYINNELVAGKGISNTGVRKHLLGKKGTEVKIKILRKNVPALIEFKIVRDKIPLVSIDASYLIDKNTGYIKINRFSAKTASEFKTALFTLINQGMKNLILDLSGNPGGYMDAAIEICDQFFNTRKLIVYTEGRQRARRDYYSDISSMLPHGRLVVIIDEGSASASEILAGAIQDWDRGVILGRKSFGKGLVQEPFTLSDNSSVRLTVARYYTPSGRFIQKPYKNGTEEYYKEMFIRYQHGEFYAPDSIVFPDSLKYKTHNGRTVYGGGAIMPDVFISLDTSLNSNFLRELISNSIFNNFSIQYIDKNREYLQKVYPDLSAFKNKFKSETIIDEFLEFADKNDVQINDNDYNRSKPIIFNNLKAIIARQLYGDDAFYVIVNRYNEMFNKAYEVINSKQYDALLQVKIKNN